MPGYVSVNRLGLALVFIFKTINSGRCPCFKKDDGFYKTIGIVNGHYVVKTPKGSRKVKIDVQNKKTFVMK